MIGALRAIEHRDVPAVSQFLIRVRGADAKASFASPPMLEWKYLLPRSEWAESRGFVLEKDGQIVAFGGVIPAQISLPNGDTVKSGTIIDWAADRRVPGAGVIVLNKLLNKTGTMFIPGGTKAARDVLLKVGFRSTEGVPLFALWVRPLKEFWMRPKTCRSALRLLHGISHFRPRWSQTRDWESVPVKEFDQSLEPILNRHDQSSSFCHRTVENLNYMLRCPAVKMNGFLLCRKGEMVGYFILAKAEWEGRILDICVDSSRKEDWNPALATATRTIASEPEICRILAWAGSPKLRDALVQRGFWQHHETPITFRDPKNVLNRAFPLALQMFDGESAYLP